MIIGSTSSSRQKPRPEKTIDDVERSQLLDLLNSHGQSFLTSFELPAPKSTTPKSSKKKRKFQALQDAAGTTDVINESGIQQHDSDSLTLVGPSTSTSRAPDVVVFDSRTSTSSHPLVRGNGKGFMSSKIQNVRDDPHPRRSGTEDCNAELDEETSNARNDKLLHELVHSQLLNNPNEFDTKQGSAKRSRMVAGRLLELANDAKLGQGTKSLKERENARHAQRVRLGLRDKARQREAKALEEAKALGNYHPSIKRNFENLNSKAAQRRERGLALGVGKFRNGALKISRNELRSVEGAMPTNVSSRLKGSKRR